MFKRKKNAGQKRTTIIDSDSSSEGSGDESALSSAFKRRKNDTQKRTTPTSVATSTKVRAPSFSSTIDHSHSRNLSKTDEATKETILYAKDDSDDSQKLSKGPYKVPFSKPTTTTTVGLKASSNIKSTTSQDYQPDVCKDYKLTGFCGYGDACKFLHMREDYKAGWQIEREWEIKNREDDPPRDAGGVSRDADTATSRADSGIPDTCPICQGEFKSPVVTQCCHYFCEKCFLAKHKKKQNCFVCGKNTNGVCKPFKR